MCDPTLLPDYIPREWADRITILEDERGRHYLWTGWNNGEGHGKVRIDGKACYTHRIIVERVRGVVLGTLDYVDHKCERKACLNYDHLEPVTPGENVARGPGRHWQYKKRDYYGKSSEKALF